VSIHHEGVRFDIDSSISGGGNTASHMAVSSAALFGLAYSASPTTSVILSILLCVEIGHNGRIELKGIHARAWQ